MADSFDILGMQVITIKKKDRTFTQQQKVEVNETFIWQGDVIQVVGGNDPIGGGCPSCCFWECASCYNFAPAVKCIPHFVFKKVG